MKKNLLIPFDFKIESLNTLKIAVQQNPTTEIHVILLYAKLLNNSITDLLFYSPREIIKSMLNKDFEDALSIIKNRYENNLKKVEIKLIHSKNLSTINRFLKSNHVEEIFIPRSYKLEMSNNGLDLIPLLKSSGVTIREVDWKQTLYNNQSNRLESIFNTHH